MAVTLNIEAKPSYASPRDVAATDSVPELHSLSALITFVVAPKSAEIPYASS